MSERLEKTRPRPMVVVALFAVLTCGLTYPIVITADHALLNPGDPMLNTWIMSWEVSRLAAGKLGGFFDANIFHPYSGTLAYSDMLIPQAIVFAVPFLGTGNPVLAYNLVLLATMTATALGAWLLARWLVREPLAALVAGAIFAFCPFMFSHLSHLQVLSASGIPLTLLAFHRYQSSGRARDVVLMALFYAMQLLASTYFGMYLTLVLGFFLAHDFVTRSRWRDRRYWMHMALAAAIVLLLAGPFYWQYVDLRHTMGFVRPPGAFDADLGNYLATPKHNFLYGKITAVFRDHERELFPGIVALSLAVIGVAAAAARGSASRRSGRLVFVEVLIVALLTVVVAVSVTGGFDWSVAGVRVRAHGVELELTLLLLLAGVRAWLLRRDAPSRGFVPALQRPWSLYAVTLLAAFLFTFGSKGPYLLLYEYVPGFDGLRVASRWAVVLMLCLALFAALGARVLLSRVAPRLRSRVVGALLVLLCVEYLAVDLPAREVPVGDAVPDVYRWLAVQEPGSPVLELPMLGQGNARRQYLSTYHWQPLVNGHSGYYPPLSDAIRRRAQGFPSEKVLADLETIGVRFVVLHRQKYPWRKWRRMDRRIRLLDERIRLVRDFGPVRVYELPGRSSTPLARDRPPVTGVPRARWSVAAKPGPEYGHQVLDGDRRTAWRALPAFEASSLAVDLGSVEDFRAVVLELGDSLREYPRSLRIEASLEGDTWNLVAEVPDYRHPIVEYFDPLDSRVEVHFPPTTARRLRLSLMESQEWPWAVHELHLLP